MNNKTFVELEREAYMNNDAEKAELLSNQTDLEELETTHEKELDDLRDEISDLKDENHELEMKLSKAEDRLHTLCAKIDEEIDSIIKDLT